MQVTMRIEGINLEKLLREAIQQGIVIRRARRVDERTMEAKVHSGQEAALAALCERSGWRCRRIRTSAMVRVLQTLRRRPAFVPAMALGMLLVWLSSQMILCVHVEQAGENVAAVRRALAQQGVRVGTLKRAVELGQLRAQLAYALPGLAFAGVRYEGSTLVVQGHPAVPGEDLSVAGSGTDIVAAQSGIVTKLWASAGTPVVEPGQAVHKGQVLIAGYERGEKGTQIPVTAQGKVSAKIYLRGEARTSMKETHTVETGQTRTRVTLCTPWSRRVVRDVKPFASQDESRERQAVVGLYLPLWREKETLAQTEIFVTERDQADAASMAQGAAEKIAVKQCPQGALILDKWVKYSMIDNEFVYASVVLEVEADIAGRMK